MIYRFNIYKNHRLINQKYIVRSGQSRLQKEAQCYLVCPFRSAAWQQVAPSLNMLKTLKAGEASQWRIRYCLDWRHPLIVHGQFPILFQEWSSRGCHYVQKLSRKGSKLVCGKPLIQDFYWISMNTLFWVSKLLYNLFKCYTSIQHWVFCEWLHGLSTTTQCTQSPICFWCVLHPLMNAN